MMKWRLLIALLVPSVAVLFSCQEEPPRSRNRFDEVVVSSAEGHVDQVKYSVLLDELSFSVVLQNDEGSIAAIVLDEGGEAAALAFAWGPPEGAVGHVTVFAEPPSSAAALDLLNRDFILRLPAPEGADVGWKNTSGFLRILAGDTVSHATSHTSDGSRVVFMDNSSSGGESQCGGVGGRTTQTEKCKQRVKAYARCRAANGSAACINQKKEASLVCGTASPGGGNLFAQ